MTEVASIALVGAGRMGSMHLRALEAARRIRVTDVVEPYALRREQCAAQGLRTHTTVAALLENTSPDGVLVCAPTDQHALVVRQLIDAGVPVLCEKPAGLSWLEVAETGRRAAEAGVALQVAYWRRFVPDLVALRERIVSGELGEVLHVVCEQWDGSPPPVGFRSASGGIFVDMAVHEFDQVRWLTGSELDVAAAVTTPAVDPQARPDADVGQVLLRLAGDRSAVVSLGRHYPVGDMVTVEVFATRGHVRLAVLDPADGDTAMLEALLRQGESFADLVQGGPRRGAGTEDAVAAMRAADTAAQRAADRDVTGQPTGR